MTITRQLIFSSCFLITAVSDCFAVTERWDVFEVELQGPSDGNPSVGVELSATFTNQQHAAIAVRGFYDGEGIYKIRLMPPATGTWRYTTRSKVSPVARKTMDRVTRNAGPIAFVHIAFTR